MFVLTAEYGLDDGDTPFAVRRVCASDKSVRTLIKSLYVEQSEREVFFDLDEGEILDLRVAWETDDTQVLIEALNGTSGVRFEVEEIEVFSETHDLEFPLDEPSEED
jgi:hypothetical protein